MKVKINYEIGKYEKFAEGELLKETASQYIIRDRDGNVREIAKKTVLEFVRYEAGKTTKA